MKHLLPLLLCVLFASSCASPEFLGKPVEMVRSIEPAPDASRTVTVKKNSIYIDNQSDPTECVIMPEGTYTFAGYDAEFDYYESAYMMERRKLRDLSVTKQWMFRGGIALARSKDNPIQAAVYTNGNDPREKGITWVLGSAFTKKEGKLWTRSDKAKPDSAK